MRFRKLGVAILAASALCAIAVSNASAAATTEAKEWYVGSGKGTTLATAKTINLNIKSGTTATLESKVGTKETPIKLSSPAFKCKSCTIENKEATPEKQKGKVVAFGTGKVLFEKVTVNTPANCKVTGGAVESNLLTVHADFMNGTKAVQQFIPAAGEGKSFALFELENNGGTCSVAGLYSVTGTLFADAKEPTEVLATEQQVNISPAIESADGGGLFIGSKPADLNAEGIFSVPNSAGTGLEPFGVK